MQKIILTSSGLKNILFNSCDSDLYDNEFSFIFGKRVVKMKCFYAEFISPVVSHLRQSDPTINSLNFNDSIISIQNNLKEKYSNSQLCLLPSSNTEQVFSEDVISLFQQISSGYEIEINEKQSLQMRLLSILLGNEDMYSAINNSYSNKINESNFDEYLHVLPYYQYLAKSISSSNLIQFSDIIDYISSHFYSIDHHKLLKLPKLILHSIISNKNLKLENEDSLIEFIDQIYSTKESEYFTDDDKDNIDIIDFYEQVNISALSERKFTDFLEQIDPSSISALLWQKMCQYFKKNHRQKRNHDSKSQSLFNYDGNMSNSFNGIIHHFTKKYGGNVDENGIIKITASSAIVGYSAKYVADLDDSRHYFSSLSREDSWLLYDFGDRKINPTHYTIRARHDVGRGQGHPKYWVIEGSNSDSNDNWILLDSRNGVTELDEANAVATYEIQSHRNEEFKLIRIRQINENSQGSYNLAFSALEFFGSVN